MDQNPMKNQALRQQNPQSGSIFIWIFVMIALFAGLSFVMSQSSRTGVASITSEKNKLALSEVLEYLNTVRAGVKTLILSGCSVTTLDFTNSIYKRNNGAALELAPPTTSSDCAVYGAQGANIRPVTFEKLASATPSANPTSRKPGHFSTRFVDAGLGSSENDLLFAMNSIDPAFCIAFRNYIAGQTYTTNIVDDYAVAADNSYTTGNAGSLDPITTINGTQFVAITETASPSYCLIGTIINVR